MTIRNVFDGKILASVVALGAAFGAVGEITYPVYTVSVEEGTTNRFDDATVSVLAEAEGTPESVAA